LESLTQSKSETIAYFDEWVTATVSFTIDDEFDPLQVLSGSHKEVINVTKELITPPKTGYEGI